MKLNLGCGKRSLEGWVNVDRSPDVSVDRHFDLSDGIFVNYLCKRGEVDVINARALVAHIPRECQHRFVQECWEALRPGGALFIMVPYGDRHMWGDPTHCGGWVDEPHALATVQHFTAWSHNRRDAHYGGRARFEVAWSHMLEFGDARGLWHSHGSHMDWDTFRRLHSGLIDSLCYWLVKPGEDPVDWQAIDREIVRSGKYPSGYWSQHGR